jgi:hypothetical protein
LWRKCAYRRAPRRYPSLARRCLRRRRQILETDAVEDILTRGQAVDQSVSGEISFKQRIDEDGTLDSLETVGGRDLGQHAGGTVGARPDHRGIERDVARLDAVRDYGAIGRVTQVRLGYVSHRANRGRGRCGAQKPTT